jgi:hypothetical protein
MSDVRRGLPEGMLYGVTFTVTLPEAAATNSPKNRLIGAGGVAGTGWRRGAGFGEQWSPKRADGVSFRHMQAVIDAHRHAIGDA